MAEALIVRMAEPSDRGRLMPRWVSSVGILALESPVKRPWPHGLDVDATLIFDIDADRVVANIDVHIFMAPWAVDDGIRWPTELKPASLAIDERTLAEGSFDQEVEMLKSSDGSLGEIRIGTLEPDQHWLLSDAVAARINGDELVGFVVRLPSEVSA